MTSRCRALVPISVDLLQDLLCFPPDVKILWLWSSPDPRTIILEVENPEFDPVPRGQDPPTIRPLYQSVTNRAVVLHGWQKFDGDVQTPGKDLEGGDHEQISTQG